MFFPLPFRLKQPPEFTDIKQEQTTEVEIKSVYREKNHRTVNNEKYHDGATNGPQHIQGSYGTKCISFSSAKKKIYISGAFANLGKETIFFRHFSQ
jgi:hypothetical protein